MWKLKRGRDSGVIGRPEARWRSVGRVLSDDICTSYQDSATEKDEIDPAVEYGNEIQEISGLTAGRDASNTRLERSVVQSRRDQVVVRYAAAVTRRVQIADEDNRQLGGCRAVENLGRLRSLDDGSKRQAGKIFLLTDQPNGHA